MSCIVFYFELADIHVVKELGAFLMAKFRPIGFVFRKKPNPQNKPFGVQETCTELCETVVVWITVSFSTFFPETHGVKNLQIEQKNTRFLAFYWTKMWKFWMMMAVPKLETLLTVKQIKKFGFGRDTLSDPRRHFTVQSARQNGLITRQCSI